MPETKEMVSINQNDDGLYPDVFQKILNRHKSESPHFFQMQESELFELNIPSSTENRLRLKFWIEYDRVTDPDSIDKQISVYNIICNICTEDFFYDVYLKSALKCAWLLCMPEEYRLGSQERLAILTHHIRDIINLPHATYDEDGNLLKVNMALANLKFKIYESLSNRVHGSITQKLVNVNLTGKDKKLIKSLSENVSEADLKSKIKQLQEKERTIMALPDSGNNLVEKVTKNEVD